MEKTKIFDYDDDPDGIPEALPEGTPLLDGKFSIDSLIGNGGFGITYLARDTYLERAVVIKECFPEVFCFRFEFKISYFECCISF